MDKKNTLKPIETTSVVQQIIDRLTELIVSRELRPGDKIPTEMELAEAFGVGRNSVREAVKILVFLGVLEIRRAEGTFVREGFSESMIDPMVYGIILSNDDSQEYVKELRELMEVAVAEIVMTKLTPEGEELLYQKYCDMEQAIHRTNLEKDEWVLGVYNTDNNFHNTLTSLGLNPLLDKINAVVRLLTAEIRMRTVRNMLLNGEGDDLLATHKDLLDLIKSRNPANIRKVIKAGYFYEKGVLDENRNNDK